MPCARSGGPDRVARQDRPSIGCRVMPSASTSSRTGSVVVASAHDDDGLAAVPVDELLEPGRAVVQVTVTEVRGDPEVVGQRLDRAGVGDVVGGIHRLDLLEVDRRREPRDVARAPAG